MAIQASPRHPSLTLRYDHDAELLLIVEAGRLLADRTRGVEALRSVTAMLERQQRLAACRARGRSLAP